MKKVLAWGMGLALCAIMVAPMAMAQVIDQGPLESLGEAAGINQGNTDLPAVIGGIIKVVLSFLGVVMVVIIIYAGWLYMTAGGDTEGTKKAKAMIINAVIGLALILMAYAIANFVIGQLQTATNG